MESLLFLLLGFGPGIFWLWLIYQRDRYIPAPVHLIVRTFLWGIAISVPVIVVEMALLFAVGYDFEGGEPSTSFLAIAYASFIVAGMTEEAAKYYVVRKSVYRSPYFRQPLDGIMFASATALGFASIENVSYMASFGAAVILVRAPFSTIAHVLFSAFWGYGLGFQKQSDRIPQLANGLLVIGIGLHGLFNFFLFIGGGYVGWTIALFLASGIAFVLLVRAARRQSPFRYKVASVLVTCSSCSMQSGFGAFHCTQCGHSLGVTRFTQGMCSRCGGAVDPRHGVCTACGSRLDRRLVRAATSDP